MKFKQFLNEEPLNPEHHKEYSALGKKVDYQNRYNDMFGKGNDRVYIKIPGSVKVDINDDLMEDLDEYINDVKYKLERKSNYHHDYDDEIDVKNKKVIFKALGSNNKSVVMTFEDIINSVVKGKRKELFLNMLKYSPEMGIHKDLSVVISRNPTDIAAMSTNRGWKSCMNLYTGCYRRYVKQDIIHGSLVVYLIDSNDKDIEKPLGRRLIKPVVKGKETALRLTDPDYGTPFNASAIKAVERWLSEKQKGKEGYYQRHKKLYSDEDRDEFFIGKKVTIKIGDRVKIKESVKGAYRSIGKDDIGLVVLKEGEYLGILFVGTKGGNNLEGKLKGKDSRSGYYVYANNLEKVK